MATINNIEETELPDFKASKMEWDSYFRQRPEEAKELQWEFDKRS